MKKELNGITYEVQPYKGEKEHHEFMRKVINERKEMIVRLQAIIDSTPSTLLPKSTTTK